MAVLAYPVPARRSPARPKRSHLYLVPPLSGESALAPVRPAAPAGYGEARTALAPAAPTLRPAPVARPSYGVRRLAVATATVALLAAVWFGAGALRSAQADAQSPGVPRPGTVYVVRPGDTLWSIATRMDPNGDPRPIVAELTAELHGAVLQSGVHLRLP